MCVQFFCFSRKVLRYLTTKVPTIYTMYVQSNMKVLSRNHCCREEAISIAHFYVCVSACVCMLMCSLTYPACEEYALYCHLDSSSTTLFDVLINGSIFEKNVIEHKMCVSVFCTIVIRNTCHSKNTSARYCYKCENVVM